MKLRKLAHDSEDKENIPELKDLLMMLHDYRQFVGTKAAFQIEYDWWEGSFKTKDEEMDFHLSEFPIDPYEVIDQWHDEACDKLAACEVELMDRRSSHKLWRALAIILFIPYLALWYLWDK